MRYLVFNSEGQANAAQGRIWVVLQRNYLKRGYSQNGETVERPGGGKTERWEFPRARLDGKWVVPHPEKSILKDDFDDQEKKIKVGQACLNGMMAHNVEDWSPDWFAAGDEVVGQSVAENIEGNRAKNS